MNLERRHRSHETPIAGSTVANEHVPIAPDIDIISLLSAGDECHAALRVVVRQ